MNNEGNYQIIKKDLHKKKRFKSKGGLFMEVSEIVQVMKQTVSEEDAYIILDIINKVIEITRLEPVISDEEFVKLSDDQRFNELMTPRTCFYKLNDKVNCIFFRFVGDEAPIANVLYFPLEAVRYFLDTARNYYNHPNTTLTLQEIEKFSFNKSVDMMCILLRNMHSRIVPTMQSITEETINEWYRQENEEYREYQSRQGIYVPNNQANINQVRQNIVTEYKKDIFKVWKIEKQRFENYKKMKFAEEYEKLKNHWETISLIYRSGKEYLRFSKMSGYEDTPDDLLDALKGSHHRGISQKALEHAARRPWRR